MGMPQGRAGSSTASTHVCPAHLRLRSLLRLRLLLRLSLRLRPLHTQRNAGKEHRPEDAARRRRGLVAAAARCWAAVRMRYPS